VEYPGDVRRLFQLFLPEGRSSLCLADFGPLAPDTAGKVGPRRLTSSPTERQGGRSSPLMSPKPRWWAGHKQREVEVERRSPSADAAKSQERLGLPVAEVSSDDGVGALDDLDSAVGLPEQAGCHGLDALDALDDPQVEDSAPPHSLGSQLVGAAAHGSLQEPLADVLEVSHWPASRIDDTQLDLPEPAVGGGVVQASNA